MLTTDQYKARIAFLRFQNALDALEQDMKPLRSQMTQECAFELQMIGVTARSFYTMANQELFSASSPVDTLKGTR